MADCLLEVCVDGPDGLMAALRGGADRVELCSALDLGGLTPSAGFMAQAATALVPIHALIRPRSGGFCHSAAEIAVMCADISRARQAGLAGVVVGASLPDGRLNPAALAQMTKVADGMALTLHRVFDLVPDRASALELAISLGFSRILTSGGARTALEGAPALAALVAQAGGRIGVLAGAGIRPATLGPILATGVREVHASCARASPRTALELAFGFATADRRETDEDMVRAMTDAIRAS